ncbi:MAG: SDR family oxidoreductase [Thermoguttaceae bacterium]
MDLQLSGKRALVTGSSSGIGEAIAKSLAAEEVVVVVHGRREAEARRVAAEIAAAGGKAVVAIGDLSSDGGADAVVQVVNDALGGADILKKMAPQLGLPSDDLPALEQFALKNMAPNPSARIGRPEDIAAAVTFLASSLAGYINGANLRVDGGTVPTVN